MHAVGGVIRGARGVEEVVHAVGEDHVRGPDVALPGSGVGAQRERLLRPGATWRGCGGVTEVLLVQRIGRLGVGDGVDVPQCGVRVPDHRVVVVVPLLVLADGRVVDAEELPGRHRIRRRRHSGRCHLDHHQQCDHRSNHHRPSSRRACVLSVYRSSGSADSRGTSERAQAAGAIPAAAPQPTLAASVDSEGSLQRHSGGVTSRDFAAAASGRLRKQLREAEPRPRANGNRSALPEMHATGSEAAVRQRFPSIRRIGLAARWRGR